MAEWISVKDRLPEYGATVLCWYEYYSYREIGMVQKFGIGEYYGEWGGEVTRGRNAKVLCWMPIPEPPKGER